MQNVTRLINTFTPTHYDISLDINRAARRFGGTVTITGKAKESEGSIRLHAKDLILSSVTIDGKEGKWAYQANEELEISHPDLVDGEHCIVIGYEGTISDVLNGLYPCKYKHQGEDKELLMTQFESHYARRVIPSIDEPEAKATFDVTLTTETGVTVLGNMPIKSQDVDNHRLVTQFERSPRMSIYLLAFVIGELHRKTASTKRGVKVSVWATPAQKPESLDIPLEHAVKTIDFFEEYFGVPYPLPKSDHVAVPDFANGAMENWGLITYREAALLVDPKTTSISSRQYIATVISHELSHQWFGNLVTMKWWNNLWLNESFATLMEYVAVDAIHPEWNIWCDFATHESILALRRDAIDGVQSVQTDVRHPDEISTIFDGAIVYAKGARLMRMLQTYIGNETFRQGLIDYFKQHAYGNTSEEDLWDALGKASGKDIRALMTPWISQPGLPLVTITREKENTATLHQERLFVGSHSPDDTLWPIPLDSEDSHVPTLLDEEQKEVKPSAEYFHLNIHGNAHFVTRYDERSTKHLLSAIAGQKIDLVARLQLLNEQTILAKGGYIDSALLVDWLNAYTKEVSQPVWEIMLTAISDLKRFVETDETSENHLRTFTGILAQSLYKQLGWKCGKNENVECTKLRSNIIGSMIYARDPDAMRTALDLYRNHPLEELDSELRSTIMSTYIRESGTGEDIQRYLTLYKETPSPELQSDIAEAITSSKDPEVITSILQTLLDTSVIRTQDTSRWYVYLLRNKHARTATWQWLRDNWRWIEETFSGDTNFDYFVRYSGNVLNTREQLEEFKEFFLPLRSNITLERAIDMGIRDIESRLAIIDTYGESVQKRLADF